MGLGFLLRTDRALFSFPLGSLCTAMSICLPNPAPFRVRRIPDSDGPLVPDILAGEGDVSSYYGHHRAFFLEALRVSRPPGPRSSLTIAFLEIPETYPSEERVIFA